MLDGMNDDDFDGEEALVPIGAVLEGHAVATKQIASEVYEREKKRVREPPHVVHAERDVLAAVVEHGNAALDICEEAGLRAADFYEERSGWIYDAAVALRARGAIVSTTAIADQLHRRQKLEEAGGRMGVEVAVERWRAEGADEHLENFGGWIEGRLVDGSLHRLKTHADLVVEHAQRRRIIDVCRKAVVSAMTGVDSGRTLDEAQQALARVEVGVGTPVSDTRAVANKLLKTLPALGGERTVVKSGFVDFDRLLQGGFAPGDLVVLAARPSMGKTEFLLNVLGRLSVDGGAAAMLFSLEMDTEQLITRLAGGRARVNPMRKDPTRQQQTRLVAALGEVSQAPLFIDDTPALDITGLRARARAQHRKRPLTIIGVDYLQMLAGGEGEENRATAVGEMTKGLKSLARELKVPVVALSQLNRGVESRTDKRPMMSDLRESGAIEQDADVIGFFYREEYYLKDRTPGDKVGVAEVIVAKHRNGPTGVVRLRFGRHESDPSDAPPRFDSLAKEESDG
jgi:replicative DNA helicase